MRRYETICIADPDLNDEDQSSLFEKIKTLIAQEKGILVNFDKWGSKQLAYPIRKKPRGYYVCITYGGTGELVAELERNFRLDDRVLKFMTIILEKNIDPLALQQEKEAEEALNKKDAAEKEEKKHEEIIETDTETEPEPSVETKAAEPEPAADNAPAPEPEQEDSQLTEEEE